MKISQMTIVSGENLDAINRLMQQLSEDSRMITSAILHTTLRQPNFMLFVAVDDENEIIGMASIYYEDQLGYRIARIEDVVVDKKSRGERAGSALNRKLIETARMWNAHHIDLTSRPSREAANTMYQKLGFELIAKVEGDNGTNLYRMVLK